MEKLLNELSEINYLYRLGRIKKHDKISLQLEILSDLANIDKRYHIFTKIGVGYRMSQDAYSYITKILGISIKPNWLNPLNKSNLRRKLNASKKFRSMLPSISKALKKKHIYIIYNNTIISSTNIDLKIYKDLVEEITQKEFDNKRYTCSSIARKYKIGN